MARRARRPCRTPGCSNTLPGYGYCPLCTTRMTRSCNITLVCGPPCAGKNTYVREHANPGDLIVDLDALITAIGGAGDHDQPEHLKPFAYDARDAITDRIFTGRHDLTAAWIINSAPRSEDRAAYQVKGCTVVLVMPPLATCLTRAEAERPPDWGGYVRNWFAAYTPGNTDTTVTYSHSTLVT